MQLQFNKKYFKYFSKLKTSTQVKIVYLFFSFIRSKQHGENYNNLYLPVMLFPVYLLILPLVYLVPLSAFLLLLHYFATKIK